MKTLSSQFVHLQLEYFTAAFRVADLRNKTSPVTFFPRFSPPWVCAIEITFRGSASEEIVFWEWRGTWQPWLYCVICAPCGTTQNCLLYNWCWMYNWFSNVSNYLPNGQSWLSWLTLVWSYFSPTLVTASPNIENVWNLARQYPCVPNHSHFKILANEIWLVIFKIWDWKS